MDTDGYLQNETTKQTTNKQHCWVVILEVVSVDSKDGGNIGPDLQ